MLKKRSPTPQPLLRRGRVAAHSPRSGTKQARTQSKTWSVPPCAANKTLRAAAGRFQHAAAIPHSEKSCAHLWLQAVRRESETVFHGSTTLRIAQASPLKG